MMNYVSTFLAKPYWNAGVSCICAPDGSFLYIGMKSVNYIRQSEGSPFIKIFHTKQDVESIDIDPHWAEDEKLFATLIKDHSILVWNIDKGIAISGHNAHCAPQSKAYGAEKTHDVVQMSYMKNRNLLSVSSTDLVIYCIASNSICVRPNFVPHRGQNFTALKCSPYDEHIFALGTSRGLILICDLQQMGIIYTLRGHQNAVVSFSWNLLEIASRNVDHKDSLQFADDEEIFNIYDANDYLDNEFGAPVKTASQFEVTTDAGTKSSEASLNPNFNFLEACESLKQEINALNTNSTGDNLQKKFDQPVTLADCQNTKNSAYLTSDDNSDSTEGSLELVEYNSSSDEDRHVDGREAKLIEKDCSECEEKMEIDNHELPSNNKIFCSEKKVDILLASGSSDGQYWIWRTLTGASCGNFKTVSRTNNGNKNGMFQVIWRSDTQLLTFDPSGCIIWDLIVQDSGANNDVRKYKFEKRILSHLEKKSSNFSIARNGELLWYISQDLEVICENIKTCETLLSFSTVTKHIFVIRESPENNSKIAFGFADRRIAIVDSLQLSKNKVVLQYPPARINGFVRSLAWNEDGCRLAYGTYEGQVGFINVDNQKHTTFHAACGKPVYSICWRDEYIFVICNGKLFAYRVGDRDSFPVKGIKEDNSTLNIRKEFLLLGTNRGYIDIYREITTGKATSTALFFEQIQTVEVAKHYITEISWNRLESNLFAVAANEGSINILKFDIAKGFAELYRKLEFDKPKAQISMVKWSNRNANKLVTCGFDGALRLFDLTCEKNKELIFVKQFHCPLFSALMLPVDERYILCTGKSITVEIVDTAQTVRPCDELKTSSEKNALDFIKWASKMSVNVTPGCGNKKKDKKAAKKTKMAATEDNQKASEISEKVASLSIEENEIIEKVVNKGEEQKNNSANYLKSPSTLMYIVTKEQNKQTIEKLHAYLMSDTKNAEENIAMAQLFGSKEDAQKILALELENLRTSTSIGEVGSVFMSQVQGDLKEIILKAIQSRRLNEWHVSLAPSISYSFWRSCCEAFAEQLLEQEHALQAATFLLSLHKQKETINILMSKNYFKEALLIGRIYLNSNDALIDEIIDKWILFLENNGNLPGAALVCAISQQFGRGYEILSKQRELGVAEERVVNLLKEKSIQISKMEK